MQAPTLTPAAVEHLAGRPLVLRASPRHGCCGGHALVPVAELGPPADPRSYRCVEDGPVVCFVDPALATQLVATWRVDAVGFGRWRRLYVDGAQGAHAPGAEQHRRG